MRPFLISHSTDGALPEASRSGLWPGRSVLPLPPTFIPFVALLANLWVSFSQHMEIKKLQAI